LFSVEEFEGATHQIHCEDVVLLVDAVVFM